MRRRRLLGRIIVAHDVCHSERASREESLGANPQAVEIRITAISLPPTVAQPLRVQREHSSRAARGRKGWGFSAFSGYAELKCAKRFAKPSPFPGIQKG